MALIVLLAVDFLVFYQTALGGSFVQALSQAFVTGMQYIVKDMAFLAIMNQVMPLLLFGLFTASICAVYFAAKQKGITFLSIISFLLFLPAALSAPSVNWSSVIDSANNISNVLSFMFTVIGGVTILACLLILNYITKITETRRELLSRGGNKAEIDVAVGGSFSFAFRVTVASAVLSAIAVTLFVVAQPLESLLTASTSNFVPFVFGIGAAITIAALIYYYLRRDH
jgi:hypothetical protein